MRRRAMLAVIGVSFCAGALLTAWLSRPVSGVAESVSRPVGTAGYATGDGRSRTESTSSPSQPSAPPATAADAIAALRERDLAVPIEHADVSRWKGAFDEKRLGHRHEAVDVLAPRNTPIHAVDDGVIAKLFNSKAGGLTVYQRDPTNRFIYYYAHLESYGDIHNGDRVTRGEVLGYVGTSGNAPADTPHLHFAIFILGDPQRWWEGAPVDPYEVYANGR